MVKDYPIKSERLTKLLTIGKLYPDYISILDDFDGMVTWKKSGNQKVAEPKVGLDKNFDSCNKAVDEMKKFLDQYLQQVKKSTKCSEASYVCVSRKFRFEIEMPESVDVDEEDYICTSRVKGKRRYQTSKL